MATITASSPAALFPRAGLVHKVCNGVSSLPILGLPTMAKRGRVMCTLEEKPSGSGMDSKHNHGCIIDGGGIRRGGVGGTSHGFGG
ncbi:hypothetical protein L1049_019942 [Liquidambar formosana]|uniref:PSII 6.1 kDa protein n=1 Tax=Liquidambar formosana TaxID=63359 RepID=A0AAP0S6N9_LIQFO